MHPVLVAFLFGVAPALFAAAAGGQSLKRRRAAQIQADRKAIAEESGILQTLDPDSPAAAELGAILQMRLDIYTGRRVVRPRVRRTVVMAVVWVAMAAWMLLRLQDPASKTDQFITGALCGFFATLAVLDVAGIVRAMATYRARLKRAQAAQHQGGPLGEPEQPETA